MTYYGGKELGGGISNGARQHGEDRGGDPEDKYTFSATPDTKTIGRRSRISRSVPAFSITSTR